MSKRLIIPEKLTDEHFLARLGLISVQTRVDERSPLNHRWTSRFSINGHDYHVEGFAADFGRPRGVDTDVQIAIETLFERQGCPQDNTIVTTAYELLMLCLMTDKGDNYLRLRESLMRLWRVGFLVSRAYHHPSSPWAMYLNETLNLIQRVRFWSKGARRESPDLSTMDADGRLIIQLSDPVAQSIRAGFTQHLDTMLLSRIEQPVGRGVYRLLQAHRTSEQGGGLRVGLREWASACGIFSPDSDKIRRVLQPAHEELEANAYLEGIEFEGRGAKQVLHYHFRVEPSLDPHLVRAVRELGISEVRAQTLVKGHQQAPERVLASVEYVRAQKNVRSPGALLADMLTHPEKYILPEGTTRGTLASAAPRPDLRVLEQQIEREQEVRQRQLLELPPAEQWRANQTTLRFMLKAYLSTPQLQHLEEACVSGRLSASQLAHDLSVATARAARADLVHTLMAELDG